jgi:hypothetical protein
MNWQLGLCATTRRGRPRSCDSSGGADFWACYRALPDPVQSLADKAFELLKTDPRHPSLYFKKVDKFWSVRVGIHYRALGVDLLTACYGSGSVARLITTGSFAEE